MLTSVDREGMKLRDEPSRIKKVDYITSGHSVQSSNWYNAFPSIGMVLEWRGQCCLTVVPIHWLSTSFLAYCVLTEHSNFRGDCWISGTIGFKTLIARFWSCCPFFPFQASATNLLSSIAYWGFMLKRPKDSCWWNQNIAQTCWSCSCTGQDS
jgi:hypothetical protein